MNCHLIGAADEEACFDQAVGDLGLFSDYTMVVSDVKYNPETGYHGALLFTFGDELDHDRILAMDDVKKMVLFYNNNLRKLIAEDTVAADEDEEQPECCCGDYDAHQAVYTFFTNILDEELGQAPKDTKEPEESKKSSDEEKIEQAVKKLKTLIDDMISPGK